MVWVRDVKCNRKRSFLHKRSLECDVTSFKQQDVFPSSHWGRTLRKPHDVENDAQKLTFYKSANLQVFGWSTVIFLFTFPKFRKCNNTNFSMFNFAKNTKQNIFFLFFCFLHIKPVVLRVNWPLHELLYRSIFQ